MNPSDYVTAIFIRCQNNFGYLFALYAYIFINIYSSSHEPCYNYCAM